MVVGNGLIAKAFKSYLEKDDVIIFASGVSNSSISKDDYSLQREEDLINEYLKYENKKFIYFSTCSVVDNSLKTPYIDHKVKMESLIRDRHKNYLIFRIPIVIGNSDNPNTFFNNIKSKILNKETITVYENITRYIIDIDDLERLLPVFIDSNDLNKTINVCFNNRESVYKIIKIMENIISIDCKKIFKNLDIINSELDNNYFISRLKSIDYTFDDNYNINVLKKYCIK